METQIWHVDGKAFHFGRHGLDQEETGVTLPSDSLYAALLATLLQEGTEKASWAENPAFVLSSTFPRAADVRFYPAPLSFGNGKLPKGVQFKQLRKIQYISEGMFLKWLVGGEPFEEDDFAWLMNKQIAITLDEKTRLPAGMQDADQDLWKVEQTPRVTIDREKSTSNLFFTGRVSFAQDCGLWFGLRWLIKDNAQIRPLVEQVLRSLGETGLGGERSSGYGAADIFPKTTLDLPNTGDRPWVTLSRYHPAADETAILQHPSATYKLESVGGWLQSPQIKAERRRVIRMAIEGSVFGPIDRLAPGQVVDVRPIYVGASSIPHPVWRDGRAFKVSIQRGALP